VKPRAAFTLWLAVCIILTAASGGLAFALTRPGDDRQRLVIALAYVVNPGSDSMREDAQADMRAPVAISIDDPEAAELKFWFRPRRPHVPVVIAVSDARYCYPEEDVDGAVTPLAVDAVRANTRIASNTDAMGIFLLTLKGTDAIFVCRLGHGASHQTFSGRSFQLAASPRFVDVDGTGEIDDGCIVIRNDAQDEHLCPETVYDLDYKKLVDAEGLRLSGGKPSGEDGVRTIASDAASVRLHWRDDAADHWREFCIFIAAGMFALGLSALLEAAKSYFELRESQEAYDGWYDRAGGNARHHHGNRKTSRARR
jgi:hypothetical protein